MKDISVLGGDRRLPQLVGSSAFVRTLKAKLAGATVKGGTPVFPARLCQWARKMDGHGVSERGNMPACGSRIDGFRVCVAEFCIPRLPAT